MENTESHGKRTSELDAQITGRFFAALSALIEMGAIKNKSAFPIKYGINRRNFEQVAKQFPRFKAQLDWVAVLARDYGVSGQWLLLGEGAMIRRKPRIIARPKSPEKARILDYPTGEAKEPELPFGEPGPGL